MIPRLHQTARMDEREGENRASVGDDDTEEPENMIINEIDGLPNVHPNYEQLDLELEGEGNGRNREPGTLDDLVNDEDLPTSVIVTNLDPRVFKSDEIKVRQKFFLFLTYKYLRSFFHPFFYCAGRAGRTFQKVWRRYNISVFQVVQEGAS